MERLVKVNEKQSVRLRASALFIFVYREHFNRDAMMDVFQITRAVTPLIKVANGIVDTDDMSSLAEFDTEMFMNLIWAMAKNADKSIADRDEWYEQFDPFPVVEFLFEFIAFLAPSLVSEKAKKKAPTKKRRKRSRRT